MSRQRDSGLPPGAGDKRMLDASERHRLLRIAAKAFAEEGYAGTSLNQVLVEAGLSKGRFYYYFRDKEALYEAVVWEVLSKSLADFEDELARVEGPEDFWALVRRFVERAWQVYLEDPVARALTRQVFASLAGQGPRRALERLMGRATDLASRLVEHGQAVGAVRRDLPAGLLARLLMALDAALDAWFVGQREEGMDMEDLVVSYWDLYRRLLLPGPTGRVRGRGGVEESQDGAGERLG